MGGTDKGMPVVPVHARLSKLVVFAGALVVESTDGWDRFMPLPMPLHGLESVEDVTPGRVRLALVEFLRGLPEARLIRVSAGRGVVFASLVDAIDAAFEGVLSTECRASRSALVAAAAAEAASAWFDAEFAPAPRPQLGRSKSARSKASSKKGAGS